MSDSSHKEPAKQFIFRKSYVRNGKRIYAKNGKVFKIPVKNDGSEKKA